MNNTSKTFDITAIEAIDQYLKENNLTDIKNEINPVLMRAKGKTFTDEEHLRGLIYSLLTNQRKWSDVEPKLPQIDLLFYNYNYEIIKKHDGSYYENGIRNLKCGNISIHRQMEGLHDDISIFEEIIRTYGSMDAFVTSAPAGEIVKKFSGSGSKYKLHGIGPALAWEYLRNVGIDGSKPDTHLKRFFGADRIGLSKNSEASDSEVINIISVLAETGIYNKFEIDYLIWSYCATGKGEVCTSTPNCNKCVIKERCNHHAK